MKIPQDSGYQEWLKGGERSWTDVFEALSRSSVGHCDIAKDVTVFNVLEIPSIYGLSSSSAQQMIRV